ncbi:hypothetical protein [Baia soyae]|uniref:hypothetical protein n=1 Tax=Baia soyae TaxID=1544746 RepID=UPI0014048192|nr:hypothetical protein [Baia soyae]
MPEASMDEADLLFHIRAGSLFELWSDTCPGTSYLDKSTEALNQQLISISE